MKKQFLIVLLILVLFGISISLVSAAPAPWGLALNHETKECAGYWAGDEYVNYELPEKWDVYYPMEYAVLESKEVARIYGSMIRESKSEKMSCSSIPSYTITETTHIKDCCEEIGYNYVAYPPPKKLFEDLMIDVTICHNYEGRGIPRVFYIPEVDVDPMDCDYIEKKQIPYQTYCGYELGGLMINEETNECSTNYIGGHIEEKIYFSNLGISGKDDSVRYMKTPNYFYSFYNETAYRDQRKYNTQCSNIIPEEDKDDWIVLWDKEKDKYTYIPSWGYDDGCSEIILNLNCINNYAENWTLFWEMGEKEYKITTPLGQCDISKGYEECCAQLRYNYVSINIGEKGLTNLGIVEMSGWSIDKLFIPIVIILVVLFIILKLKFKSFIPFIKSYSKKGLFVGLIVGIISFLNFLIWFIGSGDYFTLSGNNFITTILLISAFPVTFGGVDMMMGGGNLITLLFLNLIYFGLIGLLIGFLVKVIIKKVKKKRVKL